MLLTVGPMDSVLHLGQISARFPMLALKKLLKHASGSDTIYCVDYISSLGLAFC